jgi:competence protein ComGC
MAKLTYKEFLDKKGLNDDTDVTRDMYNVYVKEYESNHRKEEPNLHDLHKSGKMPGQLFG